MINVLVTCGGGFQGLTLFKSLKNIEGIETHLFDENVENISKYFFDHHYIAPKVSAKSLYIKKLHDYCLKNKIKYIFPATAYDLLILSKLKNKFKKELNCKIICPDKKYIEIFNNKLLTYKFLNENKLPTQKVLDPKNSVYPIFAKKNIGWGGRGVKLIKRETDINIQEIKDYHYVEYLQNYDEYSVDFSVNIDGECSVFILRKRVSVSGGFSVISESDPLYYKKYNSFLNKIKRIFSKEELVGLYNVQFVDDGNKIYFIDVNPRIGTSSVTSNYNNKSLLYNIFNSQNAPSQSHLKVVRYLDEIYIKKLNLKKVNSIVFDLDDTIISNKNFIIDRCALLYEKSSFFSKIPKKQFLFKVIAILNEKGAFSLIDDICHEFKTEPSKQEILSLYREMYPSSLFIYSDVYPIIKYLSNKKYKIFILTDNPIKTQKIKINLLPFKELINKVYYTDEYAISKPNKHIFEKIAFENKLKPSEMVMVGDNEYRDIYGAINSNYKAAFHITRKDGIVGSSLFQYMPQSLDKNIVSIKTLKELKHYF